MLIDIPDAGIILVSVLAFLSGLVTLYLYTRIRSSSTAKIAPTNLERMEFYEKEFIDMKIRLDVMELDGKNFTNPDLPRKNSKQVEKPEAMKQEDIEVTLGKSREHASRLMKKLFEDGFVSRDASARPYRYTITEKGRVRVGSGEADIAYAVSQ